PLLHLRQAKGFARGDRTRARSSEGPLGELIGSLEMASLRFRVSNGMATAGNSTNAQLPPNAHGTARIVGDRIDWSSTREDLQLIVELPFWLLTPNGVINVTVDGCTLQATVINDAVEFQAGHQFTRSRVSTLFIGAAGTADKSVVPTTALATGGLFRLTRTV